MLRYKTKTRPGLVALYNIRPGNGAGQFLQPRSPHGAGRTWQRSFGPSCIINRMLQRISPGGVTVWSSFEVLLLLYYYYYYYRQGGNVFTGFLVNLFAGLRKNNSTDFHKIWRKAGSRATEDTV